MGWLGQRLPRVYAMVNQVAGITVPTSSAAVIGGEQVEGWSLSVLPCQYFDLFTRDPHQLMGRKRCREKDKLLSPLMSASQGGFQVHLLFFGFRVAELSLEAH